MENEIIIGLDCGATSSKLNVWRDKALIFERDDLPGLNMDLVDQDKDKLKYLNEIRNLAEYNDARWVIGVAGLDNEKEIFEAKQWFVELMDISKVNYSEMNVLPDIELLLWSGSATATGIALISGTGSNCLGKNSLGEVAKVGGMSHLLSDEGSGFYLGWLALHLVTKMSDGRLPESELLKDVFDFYKVQNIVELKNYLIHLDDFKSGVASVARLILEKSQSGLTEAKEIVESGVSDLVLMVETAKNKLSSSKELPIFVAGSLFKNEHFYKLFCDELISNNPGQKVQQVNPLEGAVNFIIAGSPSAIISF